MRNWRARLHRVSLLHRYLAEPEFRAEVSLYLSLGLNLLYALYKSAAGLYYRSAWFGSMALYYILLGAERFYLLRHVRSGRQDRPRQLRGCRFCGCLLLALTAAILAMGFHTISGGRSIRYPGSMIYAAAAYTFYSLGAAAANLVRCRRLDSPVHAAARAVTLATALVSLFFLQTAMFASFGDGAPWQASMSLATGIGVLLLISGMALFMIIHTSRSIAALSPRR